MHSFIRIMIFTLLLILSILIYIKRCTNVNKKIINDICDNKSSKFKYFSKKINKSDKKTILYYTYINQFEDDYILIINDEKIKITNIT